MVCLQALFCAWNMSLPPAGSLAQATRMPAVHRTGHAPPFPCPRDWVMPASGGRKQHCHAWQRTRMRLHQELRACSP